MKNVNLSYTDCKLLDNYPSGSAVNFINGRFYLMGDDASEMLILNEKLEEEERVFIFAKAETARIPKTAKADIEASFSLQYKGRDVLLFLGSGSLSPHRDQAFLYDLESEAIEMIDYRIFYGRLREEFAQLNIEAAAMINNDMLLGIRGNKSYPENYIAVVSAAIYSPDFKRKIRLKLPVDNAGISGMDYDEASDMLFITFSTEDTSSAIDDGDAGDSYLAVIAEAESKLTGEEFEINSLIKLSVLSPEFSLQKIESVTLITGTRTLLLVSDDDRGNTKLFRVRF